jgi:site-specific DNA-adenine methylase
MKHFGEEGERKLTGCDANKDVIAMWKATQKGWKPPVTCTKKKYEDLKNNKRTSAERGFIGVACSYSGIFFVGYRGTQTFKNGGKTRTVSSAAMTGRSVNKIAKMVKNVNFKACEYQDIRPKNMLIYCDPPYVNNGYQQSSFFHFDSKEFWDLMRDWSKDNIVVVSEYKTPKDFKMIWQSKNHVMHHGKKNMKVEKLFVHSSLYEQMGTELKRELKRI